MRNALRRTGLAAAAVSLVVTMSACGSDEDTDTGGSTADQAMPEQTEQAKEKENKVTGGAAAAALVGPGCAGYAEAVPDGPGSVSGMAEDPVAVAASNNPLLKTLTATVTGEFNPKVDLVDTLNSDQFTVLAPVDDAFGQIDKATLNSLAQPQNAELLTEILTYHVIPGQLAPEDLVGKQATAQGEKVTITGSPDKLMVGGSASVICGNVQTANATVYLIDSVLMPPSLQEG
ncbi:MAG: fasciclin domain-containing protein [Nocardioidaceae bacterium]|nr:fasciclin domain-containing protein [Nocardioidaceae bacterium]